MEQEFWYKKWEDNEIGFHLSQTNPMLIRHISSLKLQPASRVFLPLCGKTLDIAWLVKQGFQVCGVELSAKAVKELFDYLPVSPEIIKKGALTEYSAPHIKIYQGDIFQLTEQMVGAIDMIYDRAALVALPKTMSLEYCKHLVEITRSAPQLLISFEYDQNQMFGPPFSVNWEEIREHYLDIYQIDLLESAKVEGGLKGVCEADELVYKLS